MLYVQLKKKCSGEIKKKINFLTRLINFYWIALFVLKRNDKIKEMPQYMYNNLYCQDFDSMQIVINKYFNGPSNNFI